MGGVISSLFGQSYEAPEVPAYEAPPTREEHEPEEATSRDAERRRRLAKAGGIASTLLSNPLGGNHSLLGG